MKYLAALTYEDHPFEPIKNGPSYTKDNRKCYEECTTNPYPGHEGAPNPPEFPE